MNAGHPLGGALLFVCGLFFFACMDSTVKFLTTHYPVPVVAALRYIVNCLLMLALLAPRQGVRSLVQTTRTGWVLLRGVCLASATLFITLALKRMPLAETTAVVFLSPLLVVLIAGPLLREQVGVGDWVAALVGFLGILLIAHPGGAMDATGIAFALCATAALTGYQLLSRVLAASERTLTLLFHSVLFGSVAFGVTLPWFWEGALPPLPHMALFLLVGALGGLGHFLFTAAYRQTPASVLAPLMYMQLLWAGLLGWLVFGHVPDGISILGMGVVAACGVAAGLKSHRARGKASAALDTEP